jgi:hypothetical protein
VAGLVAEKSTPHLITARDFEYSETSGMHQLADLMQ